MHMREGAHRGLDDLRVVELYAVRRAYNMLNIKPVGGADDGAEVAGVGDMVEDEHGLVVRNFWQVCVLFRDSQQFRRGLHSADARHFLGGDKGRGEAAQPIVIAKCRFRSDAQSISTHL